ncbi:MAG: hypothetical protein H0X25_05205 [Acidobacteriales bacterium]|nr:hypothetical protein [Terriglobales bacterium]
MELGTEKAKLEMGTTRQKLSMGTLSLDNHTVPDNKDDFRQPGRPSAAKFGLRPGGCHGTLTGQPLIVALGHSGFPSPARELRHGSSRMADA